MSADARVAPVLLLHRFPMFFPSGHDLPRGLANVFFPTRAVEAVYPLLLSLVRLRGTFGGEDVPELLATLEYDIQPRLFCHPP